MAPTARPTRKPGARPGPKPKVAAEDNGTTEGAEAEAAKPRKRNIRPIMPLFYEDVETGDLTPLGEYKGNTAEEAFGTYLDALEEDDREAAYLASTYVVFTPDEGIVKLIVVPPTEPTIERR